MAPKNQSRQPSRKTNTKDQPSSSQPKRKRTNLVPPTNVERFIYEEAKERFKVLRNFVVVGERKFDVTRLTKYPIFDTMIRERGWEELNGMVRDTNNKSVIMEFFANVMSQ